MSLLNLALQRVALDRSPMSQERENLLKSCSSMAEIRELKILVCILHVSVVLSLLLTW